MSSFVKAGGGRKVGDVFAVAGKTVPPDALACNGELIAKAAFPKLYTVIGARHDETDDPNYYLVYPDYFRVPGRVPMPQMASKDSTLGSVEVCASGTGTATTSTYADYLGQGLFSNMRLQMLAAETYVHASLETCPITSADGKVYIPFSVLLSAVGDSAFVIRAGISRRTPAGGHGFSYSGSALLDGACCVEARVNITGANIVVSDYYFCTNGDSGAFTKTLISLYPLPGSYNGNGANTSAFSFGLIIDYVAGTIAMSHSGTIYPLGTYDKPNRTVYPYIGFEALTNTNAKEINVAYLKNNAVRGGGIPGTAYRTATPLPAGYINPHDRPEWTTGKVEESSAKYPGVWWADVQEPGLKNDTVIWCIKAK